MIVKVVESKTFKKSTNNNNYSTMSGSACEPSWAVLEIINRITVLVCTYVCM